MHEAVPAIAALGVSPIVRIPGMEPWMVKRELHESSTYKRVFVAPKLMYEI